MKIVLVSAAEAVDQDQDMAPLLAALRAHGAEAEVRMWGDPSARWDDADAVIVRSPWDYALKREAFLDWARAVKAPLWNDAGVLTWNTDKRYLQHLADRRVPVIATVFVEPGETPGALPEGEIVVKPTVSGGAKDTARYMPHEREAALAHIASLTKAGRTAMVQAYQASVDSRGETALLYFGGVFSHAITKGPLLVRGAGLVEGLFAKETIAARAPSEAERKTAEAALDAVPMGRDTLCYARVDVVESADGTPVVLELELTEPSVFLTYADGAADRFSSEILRRAAR